MDAGRCVSYDRDLGAGWRHLAAVKRAGRLQLFVGGKREGESEPFDRESFDLTNDRPLTIGLGELDYFSGKIREVRIYDHALEEREIERLAEARPADL